MEKFNSQKRRRQNERKDSSTFINEAIAIHGDKYGYDRVNYINCRTPVEIFCKVCQKYFWQTPGKHLKGRGCPDCGKLKCVESRSPKSNRFDIFVKRCIDIFGDIYDFDETTFSDYKTKMKK